MSDEQHTANGTKKPLDISWQTLFAVAGMIFALGKFYASQEGLSKKIDGDSERINRQYEASNRLSERITNLEKEAAYQKGLKDAGKEKSAQP